MMNSTSFWLLSFIGVLCALPWLVKWVQRRTGRGLGATENFTKLVSVLALGPQQRVVTIDVGTGLGPDAARTRLVLGVTAQSITCLHVIPSAASVSRGSSTSDSALNPGVALVSQAESAIDFASSLKAHSHD